MQIHLVSFTTTSVRNRESSHISQPSSNNIIGGFCHFGCWPTWAVLCCTGEGCLFNACDFTRLCAFMGN